MRIRSLSRYSRPGYPTRDVIDEHPELLRLVPKRWQGNKLVLSALAGLCVLVSAGRAQAKTKAKPPTNTSRVAPIFEHGGGAGGYGCIATAAPVFLSEDEARSIVIEEGKRAGLSFTPGGKSLKNVPVPVIKELVTMIPYGDDGKRKKAVPKVATTPADVTMDGMDRKRNISFSFVSNTDFAKWQAEDAYGPTFMTHDILGAATVLRNGLAKVRPQGTYAVFYDPVAWVTEYRDMLDDRQFKTYTEASKYSSENLRAQVRDFIKWLKAQGVI